MFSHGVTWLIVPLINFYILFTIADFEQIKIFMKKTSSNLWGSTGSPTLKIIYLQEINIYIYLPRYKNDNQLDGANISDEVSGVRPTSTLTLHNVTPADTGKYKCVCEVANSEKTWTTFCQVHVFG